MNVGRLCVVCPMHVLNAVGGEEVCEKVLKTEMPRKAPAFLVWGWKSGVPPFAAGRVGFEIIALFVGEQDSFFGHGSFSVVGAGVELDMSNGLGWLHVEDIAQPHRLQLPL
jgi:hypothetical protein